MDWLEIIQTVGIGLNCVASVMIFMMLLKLGAYILPPTPEELDEIVADLDEGDVFVNLRGKSREEIAEMLVTPVPPSKKKRRRSKRREE